MRHPDDHRAALMPAFIVLHLANAATAQALPSTQRSVRLEYTAPAVCPSEAALAAEVRGRLGRNPFTASAIDIETIQIVQSGSDFIAVRNGENAERMSLRDTSCDELIRTLATQVAAELSEVSVADPLPRSARVRFETTEVDWILSRSRVRLGQATRRTIGGAPLRVETAPGSNMLCALPCSLELALGEYRLQAGPRSSAGAAVLEHALTIDRDAIFDVRNVSRGTERAVGLTLMLGGLVAAVATGIGVSAASRDGFLAGGLAFATFAVFAGIGAYFAFHQDHLTIEARPVAPVPPPSESHL